MKKFLSDLLFELEPLFKGMAISLCVLIMLTVVCVGAYYVLHHAIGPPPPEKPLCPCQCKKG